MVQGLQRLTLNGFRFNTVLDVGASDGRWSLALMQFAPDAKYLLFEPQPVHSAPLDDLVRSHGGRVLVIKKAVGAKIGETWFDASDPLGGELSDLHDDATIRVEMTTLDAAVFETDVEPPFLLKLDTHGWERSIFAGATDTLEQCEGLVIETYNYRITREAFLFWELCSFLSNRGFRPVDLVDVMHRPYDDTLWQMDLFFVRSTWPGFDHVSYD